MHGTDDTAQPVDRDRAIQYEIVVLSEMVLRWAELQRDAPPGTTERKAAAREYTAVFESLLLHSRVMIEFLAVGTDDQSHRSKDFEGAPLMKDAKAKYDLGNVCGRLNTDLAHLNKKRKMRRWNPVEDLARPIVNAYSEFVAAVAKHASFPLLEDGRSVAEANLLAATQIVESLPSGHDRHDPLHMPE